MSDPNTPAERSSAERADGAEGAERPGDREGRTVEIPQQPDGEPPRLGPRPLERPSVDPEAAAAFGRPGGVEGAFAVPRNGSASHTTLGAAPPPAALASAFGRPDPSAPSLQRPHENGSGNGLVQADAFWVEGAERDPWRDPQSPAALGPPPAEPGRGGEVVRGEGA